MGQCTDEKLVKSKISWQLLSDSTEFRDGKVMPAHWWWQASNSMYPTFHYTLNLLSWSQIRILFFVGIKITQALLMFLMAPVDGVFWEIGTKASHVRAYCICTLRTTGTSTLSSEQINLMRAIKWAALKSLCFRWISSKLSHGSD